MPVRDLVAAVHEALRDEDATLATAESLTGGRLAAAITSVGGASSIYLGGVVTYATSLKIDLLGVPREIVEGPGVISAACAEAMAVGARRLTGATYAVSTTGVAGPETQERKPVGTVFIGLDGPGGATSEELTLPGDRCDVGEATVRASMEILLRSIRTEQNHLR